MSRNNSIQRKKFWSIHILSMIQVFANFSKNYIVFPLYSSYSLFQKIPYIVLIIPIWAVLKLKATGGPNLSEDLSNNKIDYVRYIQDTLSKMHFYGTHFSSVSDRERWGIIYPSKLLSSTALELTALLFSPPFPAVKSSDEQLKGGEIESVISRTLSFTRFSLLYRM